MQKVACADCGVMILPATASAHGGFCAQCGKLTEADRSARHERQRRIASGEAFRPDAEEVATVIDIHAHLPHDIVWQLEPEFYANRGIPDIEAALAHAINEKHGAVYLCAADDSQLELSLSPQFGVLAIVMGSDEAGGSYYAHTPQNLAVQVPGDQQVVHGCSCCGEGLLNFASRFHMPRALAIETFRNCLKREDAPTTRWLEIPQLFYDGRDSD